MALLNAGLELDPIRDRCLFTTWATQLTMPAGDPKWAGLLRAGDSVVLAHPVTRMLRLGEIKKITPLGTTRHAYQRVTLGSQRGEPAHSAVVPMWCRLVAADGTPVPLGVLRGGKMPAVLATIPPVDKKPQRGWKPGMPVHSAVPSHRVESYLIYRFAQIQPTQSDNPSAIPDEAIAIQIEGLSDGWMAVANRLLVHQTTGQNIPS